jgi:raffinose/stachyose/melibiose transport system permease protein
MFFANAIFKKIKGSSFFQTVFFLPSVLCGVAVGLTWTFIYNGNYGLLNAFLKAVGLGSLAQVWLANKKVALLCIIVVVMWQFVGYHMVIQLAAMRNIDQSFYEAAEIDGATGWQQFRYITFPLIKPILKIDTVLIITGSLKYYDLIAVMTNGGPNHATEVMSTYMYYQSFNIMRYGYACAIGVILMLLCTATVKISDLAFGTKN